MAIIKVNKNTYTAESLYQWDLNQVLEIRGLSLASVPEIHFTNVAMSRAIVRQSRMDAAGVVTVDVPNSMLQVAGVMSVYVCTYEGATFKTLYKLEIHVKARPKPSDYKLEDDPEVYSFNALENLVANALGKVEEAANKYSEAAGKYDEAVTEGEKAVQTYTEAVNELTAALNSYNAAAAELAAAAEKLAQAEAIVGDLDQGVFLRLNGGTMTGALAMSGNKITGLGAPEADDDAATRKYVDEFCLGALGAALIWENPELDANTAFSAQSVETTEDPTTFDFIFVVYTYGEGTGLRASGLYPVSRLLAGKHLNMDEIYVGEGLVVQSYRYIDEITTTGVHFTGVTKRPSDSSVSLINLNDELVPKQIYGVRGREAAE